MWVIVVLVLFAMGYMAYDYFNSGEATADAFNGVNVWDSCLFRMKTGGCGCIVLIIIAALIYNYFTK